MLLLLACHTSESPTKDGAAHEDSPPQLETPGPCADGSWMGADAPPEDVIYVQADTNPTEDGSYDHPYHTLASAVLAAEARGRATVALFPGTFPFGHAVHVETGDRIVVTGCPGETIIQGGGRYAGIALHGPGTAILRNVTVSGGTPAIALRAGVEGLVEDVVIAEGLRVGLQVAGEDTLATVRRLTVQRVYGGGRGSPSGWAVSLADGSLALFDSVLTGAYGIGIYAERGELVVQDTRVEGDGTDFNFGGVYAHTMHAVTLDGVTITNVGGEGVHLREVTDSVLSSISVLGVRDSGRRGVGDGIVLRPGGRSSIATITLSGSVVTDAARLPVAVDGGVLLVSGVTAKGGVMDGKTGVWATPGTDVKGVAASLDLSLYPLGADAHPDEGPDTFQRRRR